MDRRYAHQENRKKTRQVSEPRRNLALLGIIGLSSASCVAPAHGEVAEGPPLSRLRLRIHSMPPGSTSRLLIDTSKSVSSPKSPGAMSGPREVNRLWEA